MKIVGIERDQYACNYFRIKQPLVKMRESGLAEVTMLGDGHGLETPFAMQSMLDADIVVFHRPASEEWFNFIKKCQLSGKIIVTDYDDDPFNVSPWNPYYRHIGTKEFKYKWPDTDTEEYIWKDGMFGFDIERNIQRRDLFRACFKKADLLTVSTPELQTYFKTINPNCVALPNAMEFSHYPKCELVKREIRIGWQGGVSHYEDLYMIKNSVIEILRKHKDVKFIYMGDHKFANLFKEAPQDQIEYFGWVPNNVYPYQLKMLNLDIGLCPIVDNEFNRRKTSIKYFEYSIVGASTVASDVIPYAKDITHNKTGLLASPDQWYGAIEQLVEDRQFSKKLALNAYDDVYENHNIDKKIHLWKDAYESLLKKELSENEFCFQRPAEQVK